MNLEKKRKNEKKHNLHLRMSSMKFVIDIDISCNRNERENVYRVDLNVVNGETITAFFFVVGNNEKIIHHQIKQN